MFKGAFPLTFYFLFNTIYLYIEGGLIMNIDLGNNRMDINAIEGLLDEN